MKNGPLKYWLKKIFIYPTSRVKRFFEYAPLIWRDEDYDWAAILRLLQYKIKRTRLHIGEHQITESCDIQCAEMAEAEAIIERILHESWLEDEMDAHMKKYPVNWKETRMIPNKTGAVEFKKLYKKRAALEKADWDRLGYLISNHLRGWWD
jgi:hypothetical protein